MSLFKTTKPYSLSDAKLTLSAKYYANSFTGSLLPRSCLVCSKNLYTDRESCCLPCYEKLPFQTNACNICGQQFNAPSDTCGLCIESPPIFKRCFCAFSYQPPIREIIQCFKYQQQPALAKVLAKLLFQEIFDHQLELPEVLIPVPMHKSRLQQRGYNQAQLIANELSKLTNIKVDNNLLTKQTNGPAQASLSRNQRKTAVRGSFLASSEIPYSSLAIIDDVVTTGATISEITKILQQKGVDSIQVWAIAHTN